MKNDLKRIRLNTNTIPLYIACWSDPKSTTDNGLVVNGKSNDKFISYIKNQYPEAPKPTQDEQDSENENVDKNKIYYTEFFNYFRDNFVNYKEGRILCVNSPVLLSKFFSPPKNNQETAPANNANTTQIFSNRSGEVKFTIVTMPIEFVNKQERLSSQYQYGEKLHVRCSMEMTEKKKDEKGKDIAQYQKTIYRDINSKGRSVIGTSGKGSAVAVWS